MNDQAERHNKTVYIKNAQHNIKKMLDLLDIENWQQHTKQLLRQESLGEL